MSAETAGNTKKEISRGVAISIKTAYLGLSAVAAANASANAYAQKVELVEKGRERESQTQTDFFVHFYGALYAVLFLAAFKRPELDKGALEFSKLHAAARGAWAKFRGRA